MGETEFENSNSGYQQNDDITIVAVKEKLSAEEVRVDIQKRLFQMIDEKNVPVSVACDKLGVSQFTYYKYRPIVDKFGFEGLVKRLQKKEDIELRHLSIEVKAKIFDIIRNDPESGAEKIKLELNTDKYGFISTEVPVVEEELKRLKLDTTEKRKRFIKKSKDPKHLKTPGTPLLTLDGQIIKDYLGTDTFSPIYKPKKRVYSNIEDQQPGQDSRVIQRQASPVDLDSVIVEEPQEEIIDTSEEKVVARPPVLDVESKEKSISSEKEEMESGKKEPAIDFETELISEVDGLKPENVYEDELEKESAESSVDETIKDEVIEQSEEDNLDFLEEEVETPGSEVFDLLNEFEDDKIEKAEIHVLHSDANQISEDVSDTDKAKEKSVKRIKTYSELDSESKLTYVNFYNDEKDRIDKIDFLILDEDKFEEYFEEIVQHLNYFVNEYSKEKPLKRLIQLFKQVNDIITENIQESAKNSEEVQALQRECLKFVTKKNILAEDVVKIRLLNEIGIIRNKIEKKSGHYSRQRLKRRRGEKQQESRSKVHLRKNVS